MSGTRADSSTPGVIARLIVVALLVAAGTWTLVTLSPPHDVAPGSGFETERALAHLEFIARAPRPLGSAHHRAVREYLVNEFQSLGLLVEVQDARVPLRRDGTGPRIEVSNVVARLPGTGEGAGDGSGEGSGKAVMLAAHYDSTHLNAAASRGAGDDGAAVAALLEVARVLTSDRPQNDVIFLVTDGEERGLLGARAFVDEHPWFAHAGVVFNFEARGTSGPSLMFQTSPGNAWLVEQYARVAPHPRTSSIGYEIYRLMPNNTDFTVFRDAGLRGLNFAFIGGYHNYHRAGDAPENLAPASMRHHGVQALALARHFGNVDIDRIPTTGDAIYFNVANLGVVRYRERWSLPLAIVVASACLFAVFKALRVGQARLVGMLWSDAALLLNLVLCCMLAWVVVLCVPASVLDRNASRSIAMFVLLTAAATALLLRAFRRRVSHKDLATAALLGWGGLAVVTAALVPAASYLLIWPALAGAAALLASQLVRGAVARCALAVVTALPLVLLFTPVTYLAFLGLRMRLAPAVVALIVLGLTGLLPQLVLVSLHAGAERSPRSAAPDDASGS